jgi:hypothetical protein
LRYDADAFLVAPGEKMRDLRNRIRHGDAQRASLIELAVIDEKGRDIPIGGEDALLTEDLDQALSGIGGRNGLHILQMRAPQ